MATPIVAIAIVTASTTAPAMAESTSWFWKVRGFHLTDSSGDSRVEFYGSEIGAGFSRDRWRVEISVPAIAIDGPGTIVGPGDGIGTLVGPGPHGQQQGNGGGTGSGSGSDSGQGPGGTQPPQSGTTSPADATAVFDDGTRSGVGDVRIAFRRWIGSNGPWGRISMLGGVKLPTADEADGLGTGETDGWLGVGWLRQGWSVDLNAFVEWVELGRTDAYELESGPAGGFYAMWPVKSVALEAGLEAAASPVPGAETRAWAVVALSGGDRSRLAWRVETFYGLNDTATDVGITLTVIPR